MSIKPGHASSDIAPRRRHAASSRRLPFTPDAKHFFATRATNGRHFLVNGDIAVRTAAIIHENVECPSPSPDATRVAYKRRSIQDGRIVWQLYVLDLASGRETLRAEKRSVDDQLEWLDDDTVR